MYITLEYARVVCEDCKKQVMIMMPGKPFEFKECECQTKEKENVGLRKSNKTLQQIKG